MKDKTTAGIFALLLGGIGAHKFYLGKTFQGILYLLFAWTFIPSFIALFEGIRYLTMDEHQFQLEYNQRAIHHHHVYGYLPGQTSHPNQGPNYAANAFGNQQQQPRGQQAPSDDRIYERLEKLNELRVSGVISEAEFAEEKQRLLQRL